jgi:hypothetical protein
MALNLDADPELEVVIACNDGHLRAFNVDQSVLWSVEIGESWYGWYGNPYAGWPTPAAGELDPFYVNPSSPDVTCEIVVGSNSYSEAYAYHHDGSPVATQELYLYMEYAIWNSVAIADANRDGTNDIQVVDECCLWRMFDGVGNIQQEGWTFKQSPYGHDPTLVQVISSPAVAEVGSRLCVQGPRDGEDADVGPPDPEPVDPDLLDVVVGSGDSPWRDPDRLGLFPGEQLWAFHTVDSVPGSPQYPYGRQVYGYPKGYAPEEPVFWVTSSPACADFDGDGWQDVVVGCDDGTVRVWYYPESESGQQGPLVFMRDGGIPIVPEVRAQADDAWVRWISSPAITRLEDGGPLCAVIGGDDGYLYAYSIATAEDSEELWRIPVSPANPPYVTGYPLQSSPAIADILPQWPGPEILIGSDNGRVYMYGADGALLWWWSCRLQENQVNLQDAVRTTPLITDLDLDGSPDIIVANDRGLFRLQYPEYAVWNPADADWPMFHKNPARTGAYDTVEMEAPYRGSLTGRVFEWVGQNLQPVDDATVLLQKRVFGQWVKQMETTSVPDGRYIFDRAKPGTYRVYASKGPKSGYHTGQTVTVGVQTETPDIVIEEE